MLGHRTLNVDDYVLILRRRWWMIAIPALLFPLVGYVTTFFITPQYVSQSLVLIEQQKVPEEYVKPIVNEDLNSRLASIREQIMSRSSIQPIIEKYNLYSGERMSMDDRVDTMRKSIDIKLIASATSSNNLPGFFIFFHAGDPHTAQQVCSEITTLFINKNLNNNEEITAGTTAFLEGQLADSKRKLDEWDQQLADFKSKNSGRLPSDQSSNSSLLGSINSNLDATTSSLSGMEERRSFIQSMIDQQTGVATAAGAGSSAPAQAPISQTVLDLEKQLDKQEADRTDMLTHYNESSPDVRDINRRISDLKAQIAKASAAPATGTTASGTPRRSTDSISLQELRANLKSIDSAIAQKKAQQDNLTQASRSYMSRIQSTPQVEQEYTELMRGHDSAEQRYSELLRNITQAKMTTDLQLRQQGTTFNLMDQANLPDSPTYPKKIVFVMGGLMAGLGLGMLVIALLEYKDTTLRSERDVWAFTQLPTLAVIAWSGEIAHKSEAPKKRLFGRKSSKELLANNPG